MSKDWDIAAPRPDALIESLRAFGYSPEAAIADLLDNSISAGARRIDVVFHWAGPASFVAVTDDGRGMDSHALVSAMRPGSTNPLDERESSDLGRFGLGLKTASFSQARELTVATSRDSHVVAIRRWDLDYVAKTREWRLLRTYPEVSGLPNIRAGAGTLVLWTKCDRLVGDAPLEDDKAQTRFNEIARRVGRHIGATFHRFMTGRGKVTITLNGAQVAPWDPFLSDNAATQFLETERLPLAGHTVLVAPRVLPHRSKLSAESQANGAGAGGWNQQQGFYIYRGNRLLVQGDWLGLGFAKEEHSKLARISIDFPASLDHEWQVDVKKSSARAPGALQQDLRRIAIATRRQAEEVYRHRGKIIARKSSQGFVLAWQQFKTRDGETRYRVNRQHPVIAALLEASGNKKRVVERSLRFIEETIPTTMIGVSIAAALDQQPVPFSESRPELGPLLQFVYDGLVGDGIKPLDALDRIAAAEPFLHYPEVIEAFKESLE